MNKIQIGYILDAITKLFEKNKRNSPKIIQKFQYYAFKSIFL